MSITLNIDTTRFMAKPTGADVAKIRLRLCRADAVREITLAQLTEAIRQGRSWTPGAMNGTTAETWQSQQVIACDVDNDTRDEDGKKIPLSDPLTPDQARDVLNGYGIPPALMYSTFSSADGWPRYRAIVVLSEPLTDRGEAVELTARLCNALNQARPGCCDTTTADAARLLFGGRKDCILWMNTDAITDADTMRRSLPEIRKPETITTTKGSTSERITPTVAPDMVHGNVERLRDALFSIPCAQLDRAEWLKIGMALQSLPDGLALWDEWSRTDPARYRPGECDRLYRGFKPTGTINSTYLVHVAQEYGWQPRRNTNQEPRKEGDNVIMEADSNIIQSNHEADQSQKKPSQVMQMLEQYQSRQFEPIPTGIKEIDAIINDGFFVKNIVMLGAPPASGKTMIASQMFEGIAEAGRADVVYCNLEMPPEQLIARSLSRKTGINALDIMQGYKWDLITREKIMTAAGEYERTTQKHFHYLRNDNAYFEDILARLIKIEEGRENRELPFIAVIDYLQLLSSKGKLDDVETIKQAIQRFKDFAMSRNALVFLIMAHSRMLNESGVVTQGAGRDTSSIEYSADVQLSINYACIARGKARDKQDMKNKIAKGELDKSVLSEMALVCTKNRFGKSGDYATMRLDGEKSKFDMIPNIQDHAERGRKVY